jgi:hypothetical protein
MVDKTKSTDVELVACAVCQNEIPKSVAHSSEARDYVLHFCGPDCYQTWLNDKNAVKIQDAGEP